MAMSAFFAVLGTSSSSSSPRAQSSRPAAPTIVQSLTCGGCGAPLQWAGSNCTYCRRAGAQGLSSASRDYPVGQPGGITFVDPDHAPLAFQYGTAPKHWRSTFRLAEEDQLRVADTSLAELQHQHALQAYASMTIGVDPGCSAGDQTVVVSCTPTDSGTSFTVDSFDAGTGGDW